MNYTNIASNSLFLGSKFNVSSKRECVRINNKYLDMYIFIEWILWV